MFLPHNVGKLIDANARIPIESKPLLDDKFVERIEDTMELNLDDFSAEVCLLELVVGVEFLTFKHFLYAFC
jgi:hypothetical protein